MAIDKTATWLYEKLPNRQAVKRQWRSENFMFGKPEWFRVRAQGWGLRPVVWQGYAYTAAWLAAMVLPFLGLVTRAHHWPEGLVWLAVSVSAFLWDVKTIMRARQPNTVYAPKRDVFFIGDNNAPRVK